VTLAVALIWITLIVAWRKSKVDMEGCAVLGSIIAAILGDLTLAWLILSYLARQWPPW
jgi:hypothetical protein